MDTSGCWRTPMSDNGGCTRSSWMCAVITLDDVGSDFGWRVKMQHGLQELPLGNRWVLSFLPFDFFTKYLCLMNWPSKALRAWKTLLCFTYLDPEVNILACYGIYSWYKCTFLISSEILRDTQVWLWSKLTQNSVKLTDLALNNCPLFYYLSIVM